jgi:hypothetical protein
LIAAPISVVRSTGVATFSARPVFASATPWDSLNVTPLDKNNGGTVSGQTSFTGGFGANGTKTTIIGGVNIAGLTYA